MNRGSLALTVGLLLGLVAGGSVAGEEPSLPTTFTVEVVDAAFGVIHPHGSGQPSFVPTSVVPLVVDQDYGWIITIRSDAQTVRWREEFTLPAVPATWGAPETLGTRAISDDGRTVITEREVRPEHGAIFNSWSVAEGDPKGMHRIRASIHGRPAATFEFKVE